jgi:dUTPase
MRIRIHQTKLALGLPLPRRAHPSDVGFDLRSCIDFTVDPGKSVQVPTGLIFDLSTKEFRIGGFFGFGGLPFRIALVIEQRTGNGGRGLYPAATIVDPGYRSDPEDEKGLTLLLRNVGTETLTFARGDAVAQGLFSPIFTPIVLGVSAKRIRWNTDRGSKRFGATGR